MGACGDATTIDERCQRRYQRRRRRTCAVACRTLGASHWRRLSIGHGVARQRSRTDAGSLHIACLLSLSYTDTVVGIAADIIADGVGRRCRGDERVVGRVWRRWWRRRRAHGLAGIVVRSPVSIDKCVVCLFSPLQARQRALAALLNQLRGVSSVVDGDAKAVAGECACPRATTKSIAHIVVV